MQIVPESAPLLCRIQQSPQTGGGEEAFSRGLRYRVRGENSVCIPMKICFKKNKFIYLFLTALGLCYYMQAFSVAVCGLAPGSTLIPGLEPNARNAGERVWLPAGACKPVLGVKKKIGKKKQLRVCDS